MSLKIIEEEFLKDDLNTIDLHMILKEYVNALKSDSPDFDFHENFKNNDILKNLEHAASKKLKVEYHTNYTKEDEKTSKNMFFISNLVITQDKNFFSISKRATGDIKITVQEKSLINKSLIFNKEKGTLDYEFTLYKKLIKNNMDYIFAFFEYKDIKSTERTKVPAQYRVNNIEIDNPELNNFINIELEENKILSNSFFDVLYLKYDLQNDDNIKLLKLNFSSDIKEKNELLLKALTKENNNIKVKP